MHLFIANSSLGPNTFWLVGTDVMLGVFTLLILATVAVAIVRGLIGRFRVRKRGLIRSSHATTLSHLGIVMTNDEEQPDEKDLHPGQIPTKKAKGAPHTG